MRLQLHTDYALRTLIYLASSDGSRVRVADISSAYGISHPHMLKVANHLSRLGYVEATRGRGGGLTLAQSPDAIRIGDVVRKLEGADGVLPCVHSEEDDCVIHPVCALRGALANAEEAFYASLDVYTLAQVTRNKGQLVKLLVLRPEAS